MSNYVVHTVTDGDTLQSIAFKYGVNWQDIAELNGLESPYIDTAIEFNESRYNDTVAKLGSKLIIPSQGLTYNKKSNNSANEIAEYALGVDLDLFTYELGEHFNVVNLEIKGELTEDKGDVKLARGLQNLKQQLILKLGVVKGTLPLHPEFGSYLVTYIGTKVTPQLLIKTKLEVQETLLSDPRVLRVDNLQVAYRDKAVRVECDVIPVPPFATFSLGHTYSQ